jgi:hypothetical protein
VTAQGERGTSGGARPKALTFQDARSSGGLISAISDLDHCKCLKRTKPIKTEIPVESIDSSIFAPIDSKLSASEKSGARLHEKETWRFGRAPLSPATAGWERDRGREEENVL